MKKFTLNIFAGRKSIGPPEDENHQIVNILIPIYAESWEDARVNANALFPKYQDDCFVEDGWPEEEK